VLLVGLFTNPNGLPQLAVPPELHQANHRQRTGVLEQWPAIDLALE
jgi:hypothetical protein